MDNFQYDQAEGLRRMLAGPKPRIFTFLSAIPDEDKNSVLVNLGVSLMRTGSTVLMVDACLASPGIMSLIDNKPAKATLIQAARGECALKDAIAVTQQGYDVAKLMRTKPRTKKQQAEQLTMLDGIFDTLSCQADIMLIDAELDGDDALPLTAMAEGEIVILVSSGAASIKSAYALIKRLNNRFGRRPFSVLVTGASEQNAKVVFRNMAQAASRYLAVQLNLIGSLPVDEHITRAARLGRTVVEAFPMAGASVAFRHVAGRFAESVQAVAGVRGMAPFGAALGA